MVGIDKDFLAHPVLYFFAEISKIPRCSGNEKAISDYLVSFARERNLEVEQDKSLNVIIKKPAFPGYENAPTVIIQGHMDMVCDKNKSKEHNFETDPIELRVVDDMLYATDTTLGADNGIAVAYAMALLDSDDIPHPPLKVLLTTEEETGLKGAAKLDPAYLEGDMLINIDSEEEGVLFSSCAGGIRVSHFIEAVWENPAPDNISYLVEIKGLKGGHSGAEIDKSRGNANKLMGRFLSALSDEIEFQIGKINGGSKMNVIPREAEAVLFLHPNQGKILFAKIEEWNTIFRKEFRSKDPDIVLNASKTTEKDTKVLSKEITEKVINLLVIMPDGAQTMSGDIEGLVESSTNLGVVSTSDSGISFESATRSNIGSQKHNILNRLKTIAYIFNIDFKTDADYPEWEYQADSKLREIFKKVYKDMYQKELKITAIHAGLECGFFKKKNKNLDIVALGPDQYDVHTPDEHVSIPSLKRTYEYLLNVLKHIKPS
ncbi:MAG TPA: aminoacyl-histidine dipeptidase [Atribacterota bacterium]|nr:aminoacyl-histidine dipeptidase [Atribacterota bacterium]